MKTVLGNVASGFRVNGINANFTKIMDALNSKVLWRNNPVGEPNTMEQELDMNGNDIYNVGTLHADVLVVDGAVFDGSGGGSGGGPAGPPGPPGPPGPAGTGFEINVKDYGAIGDGLANDTAAIQDAIDAALLLGAVTYFPPGTYVISDPGIRIDLTSRPPATTSLFYAKTQLRGDGPSSAQILGDVGDYAMITVQGGLVANVGAVFSQQTFKGLYLDKVDNLGKVLVLDNLAFAEFEDMYLSHGAYQIYATDVISSNFRNVQLRNGTRGITALRGDFSAPNAWVLEGCNIAGNTVYGALFTNPSTITVVGGAFEGNGTVAGNTYATTSWGIKVVNDNEFHGAVSLNLSGVYFEENGGIADVVINTSLGKSANSISGCLFHRIQTGVYTKHNIYMECTGAGVSVDTAITGCGFKSFNTYVASGTRPYIHSVDASGGTSRYSWMGNLFEDALEIPTVANYAQQAALSEWVSGTGDPAILTTHRTSLRIAETTPVGGTGVKSPFVIDHKMVNGTLSHEYSQYTRLSNYEATGSAIAVGKYIESWKYTTGGKSWGQVIDVRDMSGNSGSGALIGLQVNMLVDGQAGINTRAALDVVLGRATPGATSGVKAGLRMGPFNGDLSQCFMEQGIVIRASANYAFAIENNAGGYALLDTQYAGSFNHFARIRGDVAPYFNNAGTSGWDNSTHEGRETTGVYPLRPPIAYGGYAGRLAVKIDGLNGYYIPIYGDGRFM